MSATLSIQYKDEKCGGCDPFGNKEKKEKQPFYRNDADLAEEMNRLSVQQRERIFEDVHGVADVQEETPEFVAKHVEAFEKFVGWLRPNDRKTYNKALFLKPTLQTDIKFKLKFLRADEFDADKAASRMVKYFDQKCNLFGEEKLVENITMDDLTEDERHLYKIGYMSELPFRDRSGRPIIFGDGTKLDFETMTIDSIVS
jgi:hypothetical protein